MNNSKNQTIAKSDKDEGNNSKDFDYDHIHKYTRALHNATLNSADLGLALMTKKFWKFLHSAEPWTSADKNGN